MADFFTGCFASSSSSSSPSPETSIKSYLPGIF
jgi:hypothetical protein